MSNKKLLTELHHAITSIRQKLGDHGEKVCADELEEINVKLHELSALVHDEDLSKSSQREIKLLNQLIVTIKKMITDIDQEVTSLEHEMQGVQNYSDYENKRIKEHAYRKDFKGMLTELIDRIKVDLPYI